jgi:hypothetical protein
MKRLGMIVMAGLLVLGLAQCKKEQTNNTQSEGNVVRITLNVGPSTGSGTNNGSRVNVDPDAMEQVTFANGDQIVVASNGAVVGTLTREEGVFGGEITNPTEGQPLYFYFLGNKQGTVANGTAELTVNISDQTTEAGLPVISMGPSTVNYSTAETNYTSSLHNKCSLMKFNVTTPSTAAICITGMNNTVTVDFSNPTDEGFTYGKDGDGLITMPGVTSENTTTWAIVLPQDALAEGEDGSVYTADHAYAGTRPQMDAIGMNTLLDAGVDLTAAFITAFTVDFNDGILPEGWTTIDADGDGYNWVLDTECESAYGYDQSNAGFNGSHMILSGSYHKTAGALHPDNYLVSPKVTLRSGSTFSFWAGSQDYQYPAEHFGVFVSDNDTSDWTMVQEWTMTAKGASGNRGAGRDGNTRDQGNWHQYTVDLSAYAGEKYIAIRHFDCSDQFFLNVDNIRLGDPEPGTSFSQNFNNSVFPEGWTTIDADGDGYNWVLTNQMAAYGYSATNDGHYGTVGMTSGSYHGSVGPLTPDNYLVTPKVNLVQGSTFSFWACAQDADYPAEHFGVYVSDNGTSGWTMVQEWTMTAKGASGNKGNGRDGNTRDIGNWYQYTVDLSAYAGEKYIAIRHFNCSDEFFLEVDDILLTVNR